MSIPTELAWLIPLALPLLIGLFIGVIVKRTLKLLIAVAALLVVLVAFGYVSLTFQDVFDKAMLLLPRVIETGQGWLDAIPYSSAAFLIGLALGLLKG